MYSLKFKFLLDENVRIELYKFLREKGVDVKLASKGLNNGKLAEFCMSEQRILITNDGDFSQMSANKVYGVIWLKIPQNDPVGLVKQFSTILRSERVSFKGQLVMLWENKFKVSAL